MIRAKPKRAPDMVRYTLRGAYKLDCMRFRLSASIGMLELNSTDVNACWDCRMVQVWSGIPLYAPHVIKKLFADMPDNRSCSVSVHHVAYGNKVRVRKRARQSRMIPFRNLYMDIRSCMNKMRLSNLATCSSNRKSDRTPKDFGIVSMPISENRK